MSPRTAPAAALLAALAVAPAGAQVFADSAGLAEKLSAVRAAAAAQRRTPRRPHRMHHREGLSEESGPSTGGAKPDVGPYPIRGIDVSHWEGDIDWEKVKTAGLAFVFVKATDGRDFVDDHFAKNWAGATSAGLVKGAYHFYDFCDDGASQADLLVKTVPAEPGTLPPTIDLEQSKECAKMPSKDAFRAQLAIFVARVRAAYGRDPLLYVNASIYETYLQGESDPSPIWIADVRHASPALSAPWAFWQYDWHGRVPGIASAEVDLDVFDGDTASLAELATGPAGLRVSSLAP